MSNLQNQSSNRMKRTRSVFKSKQSRQLEGDEEQLFKRQIVQDKNRQRKVKIKRTNTRSEKSEKKRKSKSKHKTKKHRPSKQDEPKVEDKQPEGTSNPKFEKSTTIQEEKEIKQEQDGKTHAKRLKSRLKSKKKKSKTKQKRKKQKETNEDVKDEQAQEQEKEADQQDSEKQQKTSKPKKKTPKHPKKSKKKAQQEENEPDKAQQIDVDEIKIQQGYNWQSNNQKHNDKVKIRKKQILSYEDSEKIIHLFSLDAGDYRGMRKEMPHMAQRQIRGHLRMLFQRSLNMITQRVRQSGRKIKDWEQYERRQIIRELHRIRSSNRLLSEGNVQLRQTFLKMMSSFNHPELDVSDTEIAFLYRKIEAFVRGFNHLNFFRKNYYVAPNEEDERRKPIIEGGYIMQTKIKREQRKRNEFHQSLRHKIDPDQLVLEWTQLEEKELSILYLKNITNYEHIIENLKTRFGDSDKWRDFQIVGKKIDHLIKLGLDRLQEITSKSYYDPAELMAEQKARFTKRDSQRKKRIDRIKKIGPNSLQDLTSVVYNNKEIIKETRQVRQGGVIKNPSLLLKQVFAHIQSYKVKHRMVDLVVNRYPQQSDIQQTIRIIKQFTEWANKEQEKNGVTLIRSRAPVIDFEHHSQAFSCRQDKSVSHLNKEEDESAMIFQRGLNYLQPNTDEVNKKEYDDSPVYFSTKVDGVYQGVQNMSDCRSNVVQVYQSDESEYEGFIQPTK